MYSGLSNRVRLCPAKRPTVVSTRLHLCRRTDIVCKLDLITILLLSLTACEGSYIGLLFVAVDLRQGLGGLFVVAVTRYRPPCCLYPQ